MNFYDVIFAQQKTKTDNKYFSEISDAINVLAGTETTYNPAEMAPAIIGAIPDVTVTDSIVSVTDAAAYPAEELEFAIEPVQDLHGYDNPWPAGGGKNLCSGMEQGTLNWDGRKQASAARIRTSNFYKLQAGQPYTFSTNALVSGKSVRFSYQYWETDSFGDNTRIYDSSWVGSSASFTPSRNCYFTAICGYLDEDNITPSEITTQLELGSTATSYEPYANICPISGWTGVNGERTGKNLVDAELVALDISPKNYELDNKLVGEFTVSIHSNNATVDSNVMAGNYNWAVKVNYKDESAISLYLPQYIGAMESNSYKMPVTLVSTRENPVVSIIYRGYGVASGSYDVQLELGSTATTYEPYQGTSIPITFPTEAGTVYGGKVDVVNRKLTVHRVITDISTSIVSYSEDSVTVRGLITIPPIKLSDELVNNIMCDKLKTYVPDYTYRNDIMGVSENNHPTVKGIWIRINKTLLSEISKTGMIQWIQDNNPKLVYELATPIEYDITPQQVQMLLGDNNVWCDTGDTTLEYKVDLGRYIAKLQAAQAPQLSLSRQAVSLDAEPITQEIKADVSERNSAETEEQEEQRQEGDAD